MWAIVHIPPPKKTHKKTEYTTFLEKISRLQIAIPAVCSLDFSYILTCKSVKLRKIQIKSEKLTPFGGIFSIMEQFDALLAQTIDSTLGLRCTMFGYQYSEILRSLMCVYLFLWIFQGFCKEFNLIHPFDSALCFVNIRCARRGVPPLAARPSPEKFFITVSMLGNIVLCIQHLSL